MPRTKRDPYLAAVAQSAFIVFTTGLPLAGAHKNPKLRIEKRVIEIIDQPGHEMTIEVDTEAGPRLFTITVSAEKE